MYLNLILILILQTGFLFSCKEQGTSSNPKVLFSETAFPAPEDDPDGLIGIPIFLSQESSNAVSISYKTSDSTAFAGNDYVAITSGTLTFQPGELTKTIDLKILPDSTVKTDLYFNLKFSNPVNCLTPKATLPIKIINVDFAKLVWVDDFTADALNTQIWNYEQGAGGWGNNELQNYTNSTNNVHTDSGYLHITALNPSGSTYTSGRITTQGKKEFTYCRVDIRAKVPEGQGIWPALWMLGTNISQVGWPICGEIDIMELLGQEPSVIHGTAHWSSSGHVSRTSTYTLNSGKFSSGFHVFSVIWTPNRLRWFIDNQQYFLLNKSEIAGFPFDLPQFFIFNVAVGGNWPGPPNQTTVFPQHLIVDYIKVYQ